MHAPLMSENSFSFSSSTTTGTASAVGLGYGIAIAVGILVLISTITLASYICIRIKSSASAANASVGPATTTFSPSSPQVPSTAGVVLGLDGPTIDCYYPKFPYSSHVEGVVGPCAICLGEYEEGEAVRRVAECGHCFHVCCVDEWLRMSATCPVCRSSPVPTPISTPLSELIPLAVHAR